MRSSVFVFFVLMNSLLIGGCENMSSLNPEKNKKEESSTSSVTPVQEYIGQGFTMTQGDRTADEVATYPQEIEAAAKAYMKERYQFDVVVNNIVPARDGALVIVESIEQPYFRTSVIVDVDNIGEEGVIGAESVFSSEGFVEAAIMSGLYQMAYEEEFQVLDDFIIKIIQEYPVVGMTEEALDKTGSAGYQTPYYFISTVSSFFPEIYEAYMNNRQMSSEELRVMFDAAGFTPEEGKVRININLFMEEENAKPDKQIADEIIANFKQLEGVPKGTYAIFLNGNLILDRRGIGVDDTEGTTLSKDDICKY